MNYFPYIHAINFNIGMLIFVCICMQVDDKYQYSKENKDNLVHGWISDKRGVGLWLITPSYEYRSGGPVKQELTSHAGPTALVVSINVL